MNQNFDELFSEYEKKINLSNEVNNELKNILKKINDILLKEKEDVSKLEEMMQKYNIVDSDIIDFNVGGKVFSVLRSDLVKKISKQKSDKEEFYSPNLLEGLVSGIIDVKYDKNGAIFINRDPKYFHLILNYLRTANTNEEFTFPVNSEDIDGLLKEAKYYQIEGIKDSLFDSTILDRKQYKELMHLCEFKTEDKWNLIYRGSLHGFSAKDFHSKCDNVINTMIIIKTTQSYIFGGFTSAAWDSSNQYKTDVNAFIFSLVNKENKPVKIKIPSNGVNAIYCYSSYGPTFGAGHDIFIADNSNNNAYSYSNLSTSYRHPQYAYSSHEAKSFLAGSYNFQISEIEVFSKK